jgi:hypothetical protein
MAIIPAPDGYAIRGPEPRGLSGQSAEVRLMFYGWVVELGLKAKDRDLAKGLDKDGKRLKAISPRTRRYRKSAMTASGKGSPKAPPLTPAYERSRTRSLLTGRAYVDRAAFWWKFDAWTGDSWAKILEYQRQQGRDVFGLSPASRRRVMAEAFARYAKWERGESVAMPRAIGVPQAPPIAASHPANLNLATLGIGGPAGGAAPAPGTWTGGARFEERARFYRSPNPTPVAVPGRPQGTYNRILFHSWGSGSSSPPTPRPAVPRPPGGLPGAMAGAAVPARAFPGGPTAQPGGDRGPSPTPLAPMGIPLSRILDVPRGRYGDRVRAGLAAVDRVHGDGRLPRIPIVGYDQDDGCLGWFDADGTPGVNAIPRRIRLNALASRPELNFLHELGHYIEGFAIPGNRKMDRDWDRDPNLAAWRKAVEGSKAWKALDSLARVDYVRGEKDGKTGRIRVKHDEVTYLLQWDEVWARAYAQYIAVRSGDATLRAQLDAGRDRRVHGIYFHRQWDEADFEPIAAAIDELFRRLKWRT